MVATYFSRSDTEPGVSKVDLGETSATILGARIAVFPRCS
jgi:hypothetical protein